MSFNSLGIANSIKVEIKTLFQDLCKENLNWDDSIPYSKAVRLEAWIHELNEVRTLTI